MSRILGPEIVTLGFVKYPLPGLKFVMLTTVPACEPVPNTATPVAVSPPAGAGSKVTVGTIAYPAPPSTIVGRFTILVVISLVAVAVACRTDLVSILGNAP